MLDAALGSAFDAAAAAVVVAGWDVIVESEEKTLLCAMMHGITKLIGCSRSSIEFGGGWEWGFEHLRAGQVRLLR